MLETVKMKRSWTKSIVTKRGEATRIKILGGLNFITIIHLRCTVTPEYESILVTNPHGYPRKPTWATLAMAKRFQFFLDKNAIVLESSQKVSFDSELE